MNHLIERIRENWEIDNKLIDLVVISASVVAEDNTSSDGIGWING